MYFMLNFVDVPESRPLRLANRTAHMNFIDDNVSRVLFAGPYRDDQGMTLGSVLVIEATDKADAEAFSAQDPYAKAKVFQRTEIREYISHIVQGKRIPV